MAGDHAQRYSLIQMWPIYQYSSCTANCTLSSMLPGHKGKTIQQMRTEFFHSVVYPKQLVKSFVLIILDSWKMTDGNRKYIWCSSSSVIAQSLFFCYINDDATLCIRACSMSEWGISKLRVEDLIMFSFQMLSILKCVYSAHLIRSPLNCSDDRELE